MNRLINEYENNIAYQQGFRDGFIEGQAKGLEIATNALALRVEPIIIKCENEELADSIISSIGGRK
jgi:flagellar biosynthesis/type III secretory pathway protein FliH